VSSENSNGEPPKDGRDPRAKVVQYWVEYRGNTIELWSGQLLIGRSAMCRLVLDDPLVSRQHAEFRQLGDSVFLYDLKSVNGVFVNGKRVEQRQEVRPGDRVLIGEQELTLVARSFDKETKPHVPSRRRFIETLHASDVDAQIDNPSRNARGASNAATAVAGSRSLVETGGDPNAAPSDAKQDSKGSEQKSDQKSEQKSEQKEELTFQGEALVLLTGVADKALALGRGEEAERILGAYMANLLDAARAGAVVMNKTCDTAATYAVKLAAVTNRGGWIDYAITLFTTIKRPLPGEVIDELYGLLRKLTGINVAAVREYVEVLRANQARFGPAERFLVQRIEGLERLASLR
jgi:pSer/pThr/pTyr-binding forkhead associated (FHA) protein